MEIDKKDILEQIKSGKWSWMKIKRFDPTRYDTLEKRYEAFEKHHIEETAFLVRIIEELCKK